MPHDRLEKVLGAALAELEDSGRLKGREMVIAGVIPATGDKGPRYLLDGEGQRPFLRMNANNYLGMSFLDEVVAAEEAAVRELGTGPGAVRFISGAWAPHLELERRLAAFHGRP
ncbi:MAG: pyridoxal phosphate-dependent aminotransferase family protein, partial [Alphaproteobacteria bacterium]